MKALKWFTVLIISLLALMLSAVLSLNEDRTFNQGAVVMICAFVAGYGVAYLSDEDNL